MRESSVRRGKGAITDYVDRQRDLMASIDKGMRS